MLKKADPKGPPAEQLASLAADRERALALLHVSRETAAVLDAYVGLLLDWQSRMNLVAPSTLAQIWTRHIVDSLQLLSHGSAATRWIDLGSGAGFPGLAIACALPRDHAPVQLIEAHNKKAAFLRKAIHVTGAPATVVPQRIEQVARGLRGLGATVTARALAPLPRLLELAAPLLASGARALFLKGKNAESELNVAQAAWKLDCKLIPSITDPSGRILLIEQAERR